MMPDHVHLLLSIPPKMSIASFMGYLKGKSALMMFDKHANLKYKFGNRHFLGRRVLLVCKDSTKTVEALIYKGFYGFVFEI